MIHTFLYLNFNYSFLHYQLSTIVTINKMSAFVSNTTLVKCPFDSRHVIVKPRLQHHIIKCMQKYPNHLKCPFNAEHIFIDREKLQMHILECCDRVFSQPWRYVDESSIQHSNRSQQIIHVHVAKDENDEDWNTEYL